LYPFYWPHFKAGGPVQSLVNLVSLFNQSCDFYLISLNKDIDGSTSAELITSQAWVKGPNQENIYYISAFNPILVFKLVRQIKPDVIFLNGMFNIQTTVSGLLSAKLLGIKTIISPRGMLQEWALKRSAGIKKMALFFLKCVLKKDEVWHATDVQEQKDIALHFGSGQKIFLASNIPRSVSRFRPITFPLPNGKIKLVFLSLINSNKNLHLVIEAVAQCPGYELDIYGPIIDQAYWDLCRKNIIDNSAVQYKGAVPPWNVPDILQQYHFFVLPTQGENFGHAIFDALAAGVPVLISRKTPWLDIEENGAGFYIDLEKQNSLKAILAEVQTWPATTYDALRNRSQKYATMYWNRINFEADYSFLIKYP
jgi:glycosyltransferase involved in cell wall biosynthesis